MISTALATGSPHEEREEALSYQGEPIFQVQPGEWFFYSQTGCNTLGPFPDPRIAVREFHSYHREARTEQAKIPAGGQPTVRQESLTSEHLRV